MNALEAFKGNYLVCGLPDEAIEQVWALAELETHLAREALIRINEKSGDLYVVLDGRVVILTADGDKLAEVGPGSVLGEMSLVDDRPRSAEAICLGITKVARFRADKIRGFMNSNRDIGFIILANLARVLSGRLRIAGAKIDALIDQTTDAWDNSI